MAADIPILDGVPYDVASRIPYYVEGKQSHNVHPGTAEAKSLFKELAREMAHSANHNIAGTHLLVSDGERHSGHRRAGSVFRMQIPRVRRIISTIAFVWGVPFVRASTKT